MAKRYADSAEEVTEAAEVLRKFLLWPGDSAAEKDGADHA